MVVALILLGGHQERNESNSTLIETTAPATLGTSRLLRDSSLLYAAGTHSVSYIAQPEYVDEVAVATDTAAASEATEEVAIPTPEPTAVVAPTQEPAPKQAPAVAPTRAVAPTQAPAAPSLRAAAGAVISGHATSYGPAYNGQSMGCGGVYSSNDVSIMAVSPARYREWPCGTRVQVCGPAGCIVVTRQDACPGCYANLVDLSEAGNASVCGSPPHTCRVTLQLVSLP